MKMLEQVGVMSVLGGRGWGLGVLANCIREGGQRGLLEEASVG